ncbi:TonB-linked outer membrane protein, SusC/RagA family [Sphingobacterium spiritivorum]|uniref:TonB-linked outer membrane protein, SusC/RagA family n=1 Tax=Sphingobacterium spiritivorum TaxID=258 RepID=A0A380CI16_SPHSI|nr:SusC/RagA family TonB-linked outer membrane protein [Sphingobacterium spiritivorum]SUJ21113.1 TonB-linked outer membrane protein, SusC/RagA family [Sphingobacterium spiritivorum]
MAAKDLYGNWHADSDIPIAQSGVNTSKNLNLVSQTSFTVTPVKHMDITSDFNFKWDFGGSTAIQNLIKTYRADNSLMPRDPNSSYFAIGNSSNFYFTPNIYVNYDFVDFLPKDHHVKVLMGYQQEYNRYDYSYAKRNNLITDAIPALNTAIGSQQVDQNAYEWATQSLFARLNYDYQEKYLLELNGRRSGSSRFANGAKWGNFYGASLGWNMAKEDFFKNAINEKLISLLKLRLSYGGLGNQNVGDNAYPYLATMGFSPTGQWLFDNVQQAQIGAPGATPSKFTWERPVTKNIALDVMALKNRLSLTIEAFDRTTYDMLGPQNQLPLLVGVGAPRVNNATLSTKGFELSVDWNDKIGDDFSYNVRFLLADNQSKILKYYNPTGTLASSYNEGRKVGEIWGYTSVGLFKDAAQVTDWLSKNDQSFISGEPWYPGDVMYKDLNGDGKVNNGKNTVSDHGDLSVIGNSNPRYQFSFNLGATWKNFSVSTFWQGIAKRDLPISGPYFYGTFVDVFESAAFKEHMDYWTPTNTTAYYPRPSFDKSWRNDLIQTRYLQNGAYLRLKNVTLNYSLPTSFLKKIHVNKLNLFVTGENLFTYTKLSKIFDPEVTAWYNWGEVYPLSKVYSMGVNINF